jgi:hypothetical protein
MAEIFKAAYCFLQFSIANMPFDIWHLVTSGSDFYFHSFPFLSLLISFSWRLVFKINVNKEMDASLVRQEYIL